MAMKKSVEEVEAPSPLTQDGSDGSIYIDEHASYGMGLERICEPSKSETSKKGNSVDFLKLYLFGTNKNLDKAEKEMPEVCHGYEAAMFTEMFLGAGLSAMQVYHHYLMQEALTLPMQVVLSAGLYMIADDYHRMRSRGKSKPASGIIGSLRSAMKEREPAAKGIKEGS